MKYKCSRPEDIRWLGPPPKFLCDHYNRSWRDLKLNLEETKNIANLYCRCDDTDDGGWCNNEEANIERTLAEL